MGSVGQKKSRLGSVVVVDVVSGIAEVVNVDVVVVADISDVVVVVDDTTKFARRKVIGWGHFVRRVFKYFLLEVDSLFLVRDSGR